MSLVWLDQQLFLFLNHLPHPPLFDFLALALSGAGTAGFIWFIIGVVIFAREEKKDHWFFLPLVLAFLVGWLAVEEIFKPFFGRLRPLGANTDGFSFPSGHATIAWALAKILAGEEKRSRWWFYGLAFLIAFSRIYLGQHYPFDVVAGAIFGWGIGASSLWLTRLIRKSLRS
ncbi:MAG: phosphatase PAP2 family protein [Patescibacteria group bacterium]